MCYSKYCKKNILNAFFVLVCHLIIIFPFRAEADESHQDIYPYIKVEVEQNFDGISRTGVGIDGFIPIFDIDTQLFFSNIKIANYFNGTFYGGFFLGYRFLLPKSQLLYGAYVSIDAKKTANGNYFNRFIFGLEHWIQNWFFGTTIYSPIGTEVKNNGYLYEKAIPGISAEIGYQFSQKFSAYIEGYSFHTINMGNAPGVVLKFKQNLMSKNTNPYFLDKIDLEVGIQKDKFTGNSVFLELSFKMGAPHGDYISDGVAAHMTDTIFRSPNRFVVEQEFDPPSGSSTTTPSGDYHKIKGICRYMYGDISSAGGSSSYCPNLNTPASKADAGHPNFATFSSLTFIDSKKTIWGWEVEFEKDIYHGNQPPNS